MSGRYDPVLLTRIARIYGLSAVLCPCWCSRVKVDRDFRLAREKSRVLALASEFGRDAVLAAWMDVQRYGSRRARKVFGSSD